MAKLTRPLVVGAVALGMVGTGVAVATAEAGDQAPPTSTEGAAGPAVSPSGDFVVADPGGFVPTPAQRTVSPNDQSVRVTQTFGSTDRSSSSNDEPRFNVSVITGTDASNVMEEIARRDGSRPVSVRGQDGLIHYPKDEWASVVWAESSEILVFVNGTHVDEDRLLSIAGEMEAK